MSKFFRQSVPFTVDNAGAIVTFDPIPVGFVVKGVRLSFAYAMQGAFAATGLNVTTAVFATNERPTLVSAASGRELFASAILPLIPHASDGTNCAFARDVAIPFIYEPDNLRRVNVTMYGSIGNMVYGVASLILEPI